MAKVVAKAEAPLAVAATAGSAAAAVEAWAAGWEA